MNQAQLKSAVQEALERNDQDAIRRLAGQNRTILSILIRLAYDKTSLAGWRAIRAVHTAASVYLLSDYELLRTAIRKLLWSLSDESGGIGWSAPEIIGEIVSVDPVRMSDVIPLVASVFSIEEKVFRPGVLYALCRIAEKEPQAVLAHFETMLEGLSDDDPSCRLYALQLVRKLSGLMSAEMMNRVLDRVRQLSEDDSEVWIYEGGTFRGEIICDIVRNVLDVGV